MKVLFCHDGPLKRDEFNNYYGTAHNDEMFKRYYSIANEICVLIRVKETLKDKAEKKYSRITVWPLKVVECPNMSSLKAVLFGKQKIKEIVTREVLKADYIVARLPSFIGNISVDVARKFKKPCLVEVVTCPWDALWNHSLKGKLVAPFMYYATKKRVMNASCVVYVTNQFLQKRYPTCGKSVNCSNVALRDFDDNILENRLKKIHSINSSTKLLLGTTAAVDVMFKGQQYVIQALGKLKKKGFINFEYQLVGGGEQTYLKSVAKKCNVVDQVRFLGAVPHNKVFDWLDKIDIYVQPSRQEGLPRALIEAMSRALPAFGARTAGIPELLEQQYIFSNKMNNVSEICNILQSYNKETMIKQAKRNYSESKKYDKTIIEERRMKFFEDFAIIGKREF